MSPTRIGRQTPTKSYILTYEMTLGAEAVKVYKYDPPNLEGRSTNSGIF